MRAGGRGGTRRRSLGPLGAGPRPWWIGPVLVLLVAVGFVLPAGAATPVRLVPFPPPPLAPTASELRVPITYTEPGLGLGIGAPVPLPASTVLHVTVVLPFTHSSDLGTLLRGLSDPASPSYRQYLTAAGFDARFGGSTELYQQWAAFAQSEGATQVEEFSDHATLAFQADPPVVQAMFHVGLLGYRDSNGRPFYAPSTAPTVPASLGPPGTAVEGLSSYAGLRAVPALSSLIVGQATSGTSAGPLASGYPAPVTRSGVQYQFASDYQVAYDQLSLFQQYGFPTGAVGAIIGFAGEYQGPNVTTPYGSLVTNESLGPYDPTDPAAFFNETLPSGEPHPTVVAVPVDGAAYPSRLDSWDSTGEVATNVAGLEMMGSLAPGATLFNVYEGTTSSTSAADSFAFILNPNSSEPGLANVSVVSIPWAATEHNNSAWYQDLQEAQARGITVLADSGQTGDNASSLAGNQSVFFPSDMAFDSFGVVAVGATQNILSTPTLSLISQVAWYDRFGSGRLPLGSSGGVSSIYPEPAWQRSTTANASLAGLGRGTPDIAAVGNDTVVTASIRGYQYLATNLSNLADSAWLHVEGTSVSSSVEAGVFLDIDHVLQTANNSWIGFPDPTLYPLASEEDAKLSYNATNGYITGPNYASALPTLPLLDVVSGANSRYSAAVGYDLVTGWGSVDAYNLTMYYLTLPETPTPGRWTGVEADVNLTGLQVTSTYPGYRGTAYYNASIQQNFFAANSLGCPIYWVQNVVYIHGVPGDWQMNFTGWLVYPFYGVEGALVMYEYTFPAVGVTEVPPVNFTLRTAIVPGTGFDAQSVVFSFGTPGAPPITMPLPGAAFIVGNLSYNYSWKGVTYTDGPIPAPYGGPGGLDPQFGLVGGPGGYVGNFLSGTHLGLKLRFSLGGPYFPGATQSFNSLIDQTGEQASNLTWTETNPGSVTLDEPATWNASYSNGAKVQGVLESEPTSFPPMQNVTVNESGLPSGVNWGINVLGGGHFTTASPQTLEVALVNGTYSYYAIAPAGYTSPTGHGTFTVGGGAAPVHLDLAFVLMQYHVTATPVGLAIGVPWWFNSTAFQFGASAPSPIGLALENGSYPFTASAGILWVAAPAQGTIIVDGNDVALTIRFTAVPQFETTFEETGLPTGDSWTVRGGGEVTSGQAPSGIALILPNGTFAWSATTTDPAWRASAGGTVVVRGAAQVVNVTFVPASYSVTFVASGLPAGTLWWLTTAGFTSPQVDASVAITVPISNGTFVYTATSAAPQYGAPVGNFTVNGSALQVTVAFQPVMFVLSFSATGVPAGDTWSVALDGQGGSPVPAGATTSFLLPNGTYSFTVTVPAGYVAAPSAGTVTVAGKDVQVSVSVHAAGGNAGQLLGVPVLGWAAVLAIGALAVVAGVLLRRRRGGGGPGPASAPISAGTAPPPTVATDSSYSDLR